MTQIDFIVPTTGYTHEVRWKKITESGHGDDYFKNEEDFQSILTNFMLYVSYRDFGMNPG